MNLLLAYLTVLVAGAIPWLEVLFVVPAGIVAGLPAVPTAAVAAVGNALTLIPLVLAGDRARAWWRVRRAARRGAPQPSSVPTPTRTAGSHAAGGRSAEGADRAGADEGAGSSKGRRARAMFDRFGLPGLALLGPLLTGIHVAAIAALAAGAERRRTIVWLTGGVVVWAFLIAGATVVGLDAFVDPGDLPDLFGLAAG